MPGPGRKQDQMNEKGFTLMELLISLAILSIIVVIALGGFRMGVQAWEKGEKDIHASSVKRIVVSLFQEQLSSLCTRKIRNHGKKPEYLTGDATSLRFITAKGLLPGHEEGLFAVEYQVEETESGKKRLGVREEPVETRRLIVNTPQDEQAEEKQLYPVLEYPGNLQFSFLESQSVDGYTWVDEWKGESRAGFPLAVRLILASENGEKEIHLVRLIR